MSPFLLHTVRFSWLRLAGLAILLLLSMLATSPAEAAPAITGWGYLPTGQWGGGTSYNKIAPTDLSNLGVLNGRTVTRLETDGSHAYAFCSDGTIGAWGQGQLGDETYENQPVPIKFVGTGALANKTVSHFYFGGGCQFALCSDGTLAAWGNNGAGNLGDGTTNFYDTPVNITGKGALKGKTVVQLGGGELHTVALCSDGTVAAWGDNSWGQLGDGTTTDKRLPMDISHQGALNGKKVCQLAVGSYHALALCTDGSVVAWGDNSSGQLGSGDLTRPTTPTTITSNGSLQGKTVTRLLAGGFNSLAICSDGSLSSWGSNYYGGVGDGHAGLDEVDDMGYVVINWDASLPEDITNSGALHGKKVSQIQMGTDHTLALCTDGTVAAWGSNWVGQIGSGATGDYAYQSLPLNITNKGTLSDKKVTLIAAGDWGNITYGTIVLSPPTSLTLSSNRVYEGKPIGTIVGTFSSTDTKAGERFTYSLVSGTGSTDNASFTLSSATLKTAAVFDTALKSSYSIRVRTTDSTGLYREQVFIITVLETTPPTVTINSPIANQKWPTSSLYLMGGTATDNRAVVAVKVRLSRKRNNVNQYWNGSSFSSVIGTVDAAITGSKSATWKLSRIPTTSQLDEGPYQVEVYALDSSANQSALVSRPFTLFKDIIAPKLALTSPTANQQIPLTNFTEISIRGTASDDIGVRNVKVKLSRKRGTQTTYWNGTAFVTAASTVDAHNIGNGFSSWNLSGKFPPASQIDLGGYQVEAYALDASGNKSASAIRAFTILSGSTAPVVSIPAPTSSPSLVLSASKAETVNGTATGNKNEANKPFVSGQQF